MAKPPWHAEHEPTAAQVAAAVRAQVPELANLPIRFLAAGWNSTTWDIDERWVVRVPKRTDVVRFLRQEAAVLPLLDLPLAVPHFHYVGEPDAHLPLPWALYPKLQGVPADQHPELDKSTLAAALHPFLTALHTTEVTGRIAQVSGWDDPPLPPAIEALRPLALGSAGFGRALDWLAERTYPQGNTLCHADLGLQHILVHPDTRAPVGVLDWGDMDLAHPATDLVGLWRAAAESVEATWPEHVDAVHTVAVWFAVEDVGSTLRFEPERGEQAVWWLGRLLDRVR